MNRDSRASLQGSRYDNAAGVLVRVFTSPILGSLVVSSLLFVLVAPAWSHGDLGHFSVTAWAITELPEGELKEFFDDPEVANAAIYGSTFPDAGYWVDTQVARDFAEYSHWAPFIQSFIEAIRQEYPPESWDQEVRKNVAFMIGCAVHGLQDEIFDSTFLYQVDEHDDGGQDEADGGTDFFLVDDGQRAILPKRYLPPLDVLLPLYDSLAQEVTEQVVLGSVETQEKVYLNDDVSYDIAAAFVEDSRERIPWAAEHYLDPQVPGSLRSEVPATMAYMQALWKRVHGDWRADDDLVVYSYPDGNGVLRSSRSGTVDSWITMILGQGIVFDTSGGGIFDAAGAPVEANYTGTRWGHPVPRLVRFQPTADLQPGKRYRARLDAGVENGWGRAEPGGRAGRGPKRHARMVPNRAPAPSACASRSPIGPGPSARSMNFACPMLCLRSVDCGRGMLVSIRKVRPQP